MSNASTRRMLRKVEVEAPAPLFLSSEFKTPPENIHDSETVEMDVIRENETIAVPVPDITHDGRMNERSKYVNKEYTPPILKEMGAITAFEQIKREAGADPFEDVSFLAKAGRQVVGLFGKLINKMRRTVELMASQVYQTGQIALLSETGATIFSENFLVKATHLITVSTAWALDGSTGDPLADIDNAARVVRKDGKRRVDRLKFGNSAFTRFLANAKVQKALDKTTLNLANLNPSLRSDDATFYGKIWINNYEYEIWLYDAYYEHPQTGVLTPYILDDNVILTSSKARMDLTFGSIPMIAAPDPAVAGLVGGRMSSPDAGFDITPNAWFSPDRTRLFVSAGTRPLTIPSEVDSFARIDCTP